ncbi:MAG: hypothetical protein PSX42_15610 [bacterium]|nr:hypothetical protein [bacterium]
MNNYSQIEVSYLRPSRTVETILLENSSKKRIVYVYNYEGWHFRVFNNIIEVLDFFDDKFEPEISFEDEEELDKYLENLDLNY